MEQARAPVAFGSYIITRRIARGGMAEIYRARTRAAVPLRWFAIKMMRSSIGDEDLRERLFEREARIATMLDHANVVPVYEYGQEMERPFLAMEYVRGRDLSHLLKTAKTNRTHIAYELALYIGLEAARGLGHAHRLTDPESREPLGIVHRDISPGNVMVGYDGSVKVLDFGVARMNETQGLHTQTGTLRGKFAYMSPEQTHGGDLDGRSDVFSLGTVLYELLTGVNCFRAQNPIATLERVQGLRPVPPSRANRDIPKDVDRVLARCLAKDKTRRFRDAALLSEALEEFLDRSGFDGRSALAEHMRREFAWEKEEEERELAGEEADVSRFATVDFANVGDDVGLDAPNVAVSHEEEASQSEVKSVAVRLDGSEEQAVFDGIDPWSPDKETDRDPFGDQEATIAHPRLVQSSLLDEAMRPGIEVQVASLIAAPDPLPDPTPLSLPPDPRGSLGPGDVLRAASAPGALLGGPADPPRLERPLFVLGGIASAVLAVAVVTAMVVGAGGDVDAVRARTIEPVKITLDIGTKDADREPRAGGGTPSGSAGGVARSPGGPTPVSARRPGLTEEDDQEAPSKRREPVREPPAKARRFERKQAQAPRAAGRKRSEAPGKGDVQGGSAEARAAPKKQATGFLNVGAKPWAEIEIDGKPWPYQTPQAGIELASGKHVVTLRNAETGVEKSTAIYIKPGAYKTVMMDMRKR